MTWRQALASILLALVLTGCGTPGFVTVTVGYEMDPTPPEVWAGLDWFTYFDNGYVSAGITTEGRMRTRVTFNW